VIGDDIRELIELFNNSDLTELCLEQHGRRLFLRKGDGPSADAVAPEEPVEPETVAIKAHMVGTFYWTADKAAKPALALHQQVEKGQVVGLIEAMDIMNEVEADREGEVVEIAVTSGQPVEYGQTLVVLRP
jgi:acetyl-CoA carboxylase biotin carboxyl carrier protein